jgi:hypothetical protein
MIRSTFLFALLAGLTASAAEIDRLWLTHQRNAPDSLVVNWETDEPGDSVVEFGMTAALGERIALAEPVRLHHVEIPLVQRDVTYHYRVHSGTASSAVQTFKGYPTGELRVAVVADTGFAKQPWADAVRRENPHLLLSAGDHVPALHRGGPVARENTAAFSGLIRQSHELFATTPWLAALGNHDREIRPRGPKPPPEPVYDIEAKAFREFLALPGEEWHWHFDVPEFGVRFIALDLSHLSDQGTTWQTCHPFARDGVQFGWYRDLMATSWQPFVITLYNERNATVRGLEGGEWGRMIAQGSLAITGFGYFAERAEVDGFTCYNTSVSGTGTPYADPKSAVLRSEDNFLLLTFRRDPPTLQVEVKNLSGGVLDHKEYRPRPITREPKPQ